MSKIIKPKLTLKYSPIEGDFLVNGGPFFKQDQNLLLKHLIGDTLIWRLGKEAPFNYEVFNFKNELIKRGFDPKTIKFSIEKKI